MRWSDNILWLPLSSYLKDTEFCKTYRDFIKKTSCHTFAPSNEKRSCRSKDRTLAYEAGYRGSNPDGINADELWRYWDELCDIYGSQTVYDDMDLIEDAVEGICDEEKDLRQALQM